MRYASAMSFEKILVAIAALSTSCYSPPQAPAGRLSPERRIVAIGDVHGDWDATLRALRLAGAIDESQHWSGGDLIVVQTGDQLDRGDGERDILLLFEQLAIDAQEAGGEFHSLLGNHEIMNAALDFRYVTPGGFADFESVPTSNLDALTRESLSPHERARAAAFQPGGPFAVSLASHDVILVLGDSVFVHGGVLPAHVEYGIDKINEETRQWLLGKSEKPNVMVGPDSPIWDRTYSNEPTEEAPETLRVTLELLGVKRMVIGHTVQEGGIRALCDGDAWCIDVGMASHYGGPIEVLEIVGDRVTVLREAEVLTPL
jgi:hypothetical protein